LTVAPVPTLQPRALNSARRESRRAAQFRSRAR
jgi:hypothetical protein